mmetsp:Transcript_21929/g.40009  ORF Transcript_21929/g.40009 Transcript_21929/m.40009 type:complete len:106 (-) Transcript_21929:5102-5419(-)
MALDVRLTVNPNLIVEIEIKFIPEEVPDWLSTSIEASTIIESQIRVLKRLTERNNELSGFNSAAEEKHKELSTRLHYKAGVLRTLKEDLTVVHRALLRMKKKLKL